nr:phosphate acyltransferase [Sinorhizobium sp. Sb3]
MKPLDRILEAAKSAPRHIVLAEGEDPRIVEGALRAVRAGIAEITLVGGRNVVQRRLEAAGARPGEIRIEDPALSPLPRALLQPTMSCAEARASTPRQLPTRLDRRSSLPR